MLQKIKIRTRIAGASVIASALVGVAMYGVAYMIIMGLSAEAAKNDTWIYHRLVSEAARLEALKQDKDFEEVITPEFLARSSERFLRPFMYYKREGDTLTLVGSTFDGDLGLSDQQLITGADMDEGLAIHRYMFNGTPHELRVISLKPDDMTGTERVGVFVAGLDLEYIDSVMSDAFLTMAGLGLVLIGAGFVLAVFAGRAIALPIVVLRRAMDRIEKGETDIHVPARRRGDEIGDMARTVETFRLNAIEVDRLKAEQEETRAAAEQAKRTAMIELADRFEAEVQQVVNAVSGKAEVMQHDSGAMLSTAKDTESLAAAVAAATEEARQNVETVAAAAAELSSSTTEIGRQVGTASDVAQRAVASADETNHTVSSLNDAARQIGDIINLINEIASQTNLLALNATIEAARAGEMGKGFAVVASEVKNLATQTTNATQSISEKVQGIQDISTHAVQQIEAIQKVIKEVHGISSEVSEAVGEQNVATHEISQAVQQAASGTNDVAMNIVKVSGAAAETGQSAHQVESMSSDVATAAQILNDKVHTFLAEIRPS